MQKLRFAVVGSGWRALFYARAAAALPERFELCGILCRSKEKAAAVRAESGAETLLSAEAVRAARPDVIVVAVNKAAIASVSRAWLAEGYPVLCETPPSLDEGELRALWADCVKNHWRLFVAEQYFLMPQWAARLAALQKVPFGAPQSISISACHDYHAVSLIRRFLGAGFACAALRGQTWNLPVTDTGGRYGPVYTGEVVERPRTRVNFEFTTGQLAFYDFNPVQYHTFLRGSSVSVQSVRGELRGDTLTWLDEENRPQTERLLTEWSGGEVERVSLGGETVYRAPFGLAGLEPDETAVAQLLDNMNEVLHGGRALYPLAEAMQDAYFAALMARAVEAPGEEACARRMPWA